MVEGHVVECKESYHHEFDIMHVVKSERKLQYAKTFLTHVKCPLNIFTRGLLLFGRHRQMWNYRCWTRNQGLSPPVIVIVTYDIGSRLLLYYSILVDIIKSDVLKLTRTKLLHTLVISHFCFVIDSSNKPLTVKKFTVVVHSTVESNRRSFLFPDEDDPQPVRTDVPKHLYLIHVVTNTWKPRL